MKSRKTLIGMAAALFSVTFSSVQAADKPMTELLDVLLKKGTITAQEHQTLANSTATAPVSPVITTDGKLKIQSADGRWSFQPTGRIMWDAIDTEEDNSGVEEIEGTELRRARLGFKGHISNFGYKFETDFSGGDSDIRDAFVSYNANIKDLKASIKLGQSHIPFGLNTKISSNHMTFIDRPFFADSSVSNARGSGVVGLLAAKDYAWTFSAGLTNGEINGGGTNNNGSTLAVRGSFLPYKKDKNHLLQLGAGIQMKGGGDDFRFRQRLVSHEDAVRHLDSGTILGANFDGAKAFTLDALTVMGAFHAMAEYNDFTAERNASADIDITGYAFEAGYFLTGESLNWSKGYVSGLKPRSKKGAWQIAARVESSEIADGLISDEADKVTVGVNYYPVQNIRMMLNYDKVTDLKINGASAGFKPSSIKFRTQVRW